MEDKKQGAVKDLPEQESVPQWVLNGAANKPPQKPKYYGQYIMNQTRELRGRVHNITDTIKDFKERQDAERAVGNLILSFALSYNPEPVIKQELTQIMECYNDPNAQV